MADNPLYQELQQEAFALLAEYGRPMILRRPGATVIDPITDVETSSPPVDLNTTGISTSYKTGVIDGTRIRSGDRRVVLDVSHQPELTDKLVIGTEEWLIVDIDDKQPAETKLVHILQVRR